MKQEKILKMNLADVYTSMLYAEYVASCDATKIAHYHAKKSCYETLAKVCRDIGIYLTLSDREALKIDFLENLKDVEKVRDFFEKGGSYAANDGNGKALEILWEGDSKLMATLDGVFVTVFKDKYDAYFWLLF